MSTVLRFAFAACLLCLFTRNLGPETLPKSTATKRPSQLQELSTLHSSQNVSGKMHGNQWSLRLVPSNNTVDVDFVSCGGHVPKDYSFMDVVIVNMVPTCSTKHVVRQLLGLYSFRKIFFITKHLEFCTFVKSISSIIVCMHEDEVIPGVTYKKLEQKSKTIIAYQGISNRVGWYFAMMLKIGVGHYLQDLSEYFLVWDSDNIPIVPQEFFSPDGRMRFCANPMGVKPAGYVSGYGKFHKLVTGMDLLRPNKTKSLRVAPNEPIFNFVCGYIVAYRPYVTELIHHMEQYTLKTQKLSHEDRNYPWNILYLANIAIRDNYYWADYDSYPSWVANVHPDAYVADFSVTFTRNPGVEIVRVNTDAYGKWQCCLSDDRICTLSRKEDSEPGGYHSFLIWEEHKMRYRGNNQCLDRLPNELTYALIKTDFLNTHYPKTFVDTKEIVKQAKRQVKESRD
eukprot:879690-Prorocentrum_minimum.AAC.1